MNPFEIGAHRFSKGFDGAGFRQPRDTLDQDVPLGKEPDEEPFRKIVLADDDLSDFGFDAADEMMLLLDPRLQFIECHETS